MQSPTILADFLCGLSGVSPISNIVYKIRLWTGLRPSSTRGRALSRMTNSAYGSMDWGITSSMGVMKTLPCGMDV